MSFDVHRRAQNQPGSPVLPPLLATSARVYAWVAAAGIGLALAIMIVASLTRASWSGPPLTMPRTGPPFQVTSWHIPLDDIAAALWLAAALGSLGMAAGLVAVRRGARPPVRLLIGTAAIVIAILTVLPPVGSSDSLDYMAFGRMVVLGHSPYVMVPGALVRAHDAVAASIPSEWATVTTPYGPAATVEQFVAATLGGTSAARIVFWLKLANAAAFGAVAYAADRLLRSDPARRLRAHLLWTVNPLLIWQLIAAAHLDVLAAAAGMLGLIIAGAGPRSQLPSTRSLAESWRAAHSSASRRTSRSTLCCSAWGWPGPSAARRGRARPVPAPCWSSCCPVTPGSARRPSGRWQAGATARRPTTSTSCSAGRRTAT